MLKLTRARLQSQGRLRFPYSTHLEHDKKIFPNFRFVALIPDQIVVKEKEFLIKRSKILHDSKVYSSLINGFADCTKEK